MKLTLFSDGGSRGNPGPAAIGVVIKDIEGNNIVEKGMYIGNSTNNDAEYKALILALESAIEKKGKDLECFLDSELVVKQLNLLYKVKNENIKTLYRRVRELEKNFKSVTYTHITRDRNKETDRIVNQVLDSI